MEKIALSFTLVWLRLGLLMAQPYAVDASLQLQAPITPFLEELTQASPSPLQLTLILTDDNEQAYPVRLRFSISGQGISIRTRTDIVPPPILLDYGLPVPLMGSDLIDYFLPEHLEFQGISPTQFIQNGGRLPEGIYNVCVEVLDYQRFQGAPISNQSCRVVEMAELAPPQILSPIGEQGADPIQNLLFQWVPQHIGSFPTSYTLRVWEMRPGLAPTQIVQQTLPIFEHQQNGSTSFLYGLDAPPLEPGLSYLVQVQVEDLLEQHQFTNNGNSELVQFTYGTATSVTSGSIPDAPCLFNLQIQKPMAPNFTVSWGGLPGIENYVLKIARDSLFQSLLPGFEALSTSDTLYDLQGLPEDGTVYIQVEALSHSCPPIIADPISLFLGEGCRPLPTNAELAYACGTATDPTTLPAATNLMQKLQIEDTIRAHDFQVIIQEISGRERFSGEGYVSVPYLEQARVNVQFDGIQVDEYCQLVSGKMTVTGSGLAVISEDLATTLDSIINALGILDAGLAEVESILEDAGDFLAELEDIEDYLANGQNVLENLLHLEEHFPYLPPEAIKAIQDALDCLKAAQSASDFEDCKAQMLAAIDKLKEAMQALYDADYRVNFAALNPSQFGFDTIRHTAQADLYNKVPIAGTDYWVPWQSVPSQGTAQVQATAPSQSPFPESIQFKNELKQAIVHTEASSPQSRLLQLNGKVDQQTETIYALHPYQDSLQQEQVHIAGQLSLISYDPTTLKVVLVPVNGTQYPHDLDNLKKRLQDIFSQAIVEVELSVHNGLQVPEFDNRLDSVPSGFLANYNDEMQLIRNRFKANNTIQDDTYYLFLVQDSEHPQKLGYMPQKKSFGFIYHDNQGSEQQYIKTIAHELAHGAYRLDHSFRDFPSPAPGETDNLMDYALGTHLQKYQWDLIHNPAANWTLFDGDEEGEFILDAQVERPLVTRILGKASPALDENLLFISPTGHLRRFIKPVTNLQYDALDNTDIDPFPRGSLVGFTYEGKEWAAIYRSGTNQFLGFVDNAVFDQVNNDVDEARTNGDDEAVITLGKIQDKDSRAIFKFWDAPPESSGTVVTEVLEGCLQKRKTWEAYRDITYILSETNCLPSIEIPSDATSLEVGLDPNCADNTTNPCQTTELPQQAIPIDADSPLAQAIFNASFESIEEFSPADDQMRIHDYTRFQRGFLSSEDILDLANELEEHREVNGNYALMQVYLTDCNTPEDKYQKASSSPLDPNEWVLHFHFIEKEGNFYAIPTIRFGETIQGNAEIYRLQAKLFTTINRFLLDNTPAGPGLLFLIKTLSWGAGHTAKLLAKDFQISERYWKVYLENGAPNPEYSGKYAQFFNNYIETTDPSSNNFLLYGRDFDLESLDAVEQMKFAFFCGMWNQTMEEGANLAQFIELAVDFFLDEHVCANVLEALNELTWEKIVKGLLPNFKTNIGLPNDEIYASYIAGQNLIIAAVFLVEVVDMVSGAGALVTAFKKLKDITSATLVKAMIDIRKKLNLRGFKDPDNPQLLIVCATSLGSGIGYQPASQGRNLQLAAWGIATVGLQLSTEEYLEWLAQCDRRLFRLNENNGNYRFEKEDIDQHLPEEFEIVEGFELNSSNTEGLPTDVNGEDLVIVKDKGNGEHWVLTRSYIRLVDQIKSHFNASPNLAAQVARLDNAEELIENLSIRDAILELGDRKNKFLEDLAKMDNLSNGINIQNIGSSVVKAWNVFNKHGDELATNLPTLTRMSDDINSNPNLEPYLSDIDNLENWKSVKFVSGKSFDISFLDWNKVFQNWTSGNGKNLHEHIFKGKTGGTNGISGVHHVDALTKNTINFNVGDIRMTPGTKTPKENGFYEAEIEYWDGGNWVQKTENGVPVKNGFYPNNWTQKQVMEEISYARSKVEVSNWVPPTPPNTTSNSYVRTLNSGEDVIFYIGQARSSLPANVGTYTISVFPVF